MVEQNPPMPVQVTAGQPQTDNQINIADYAGQLVGDPSMFMTTDNPNTTGINESMFLSDRNTTADANAAGTNINAGANAFQMTNDALNATATTVGDDVQQAQTTTAPTDVASYDAQQTFDDVAQQGMDAFQGQVSEGAKIDADEVPQADMQGAATGMNEDGTVNYLGDALKDYASQNISNVIDTSTVSGKLLAQQLGEGNYTDSKATITGQLDILAAQFVDEATGEPKIPTWAAGTARNVSRIAAFKGVTGTAATSAMAQAIMEATIPIAESEAGFFRSVTLQNLSNKQQSTINRANVLSKMELTNLDNRMASAIQNSKNFIQMDLSNMDAENQARVINTQARVQSILEDSKAVNTQRMFTAQEQNQSDQFYDNLNASIEQFNASQVNSMKQFDAGEENAISQFNANLENNREQFYKNMQYNIEVSNAKWRQEVTLNEDRQNFEAATRDVAAMLDISSDQLSNIWDRSDALLDYVWKTSENSKNRSHEIVKLKLKGELDEAAADAAGTGAAVAGVITNAGDLWEVGKDIWDLIF
tara:strand:- start:4281 stop:5882 length:1602 start_codon:yes stop_codon:yes gene_type:complete